MALIGSQSVIFRSPGTRLSGGLSSCRANWESTSQMRSAWVCDGGACFGKKVSIPDGVRPPYAWVMAISDGGLASRRQIFGTGEITAGNLAGGKNGTAALSGSGDITSANLGLILSAVAALSGSGDLTASMVGKLEAAAALTGNGDAAAALSAIASIISALTGAGDAAGTTTASGSMSAGITSSGDVLTTSNVADAVWNSISEGTLTRDDLLRIIAAACAGKTSGQPTAPTFRTVTDSADMITATVDTDGNRTAVTVTP